MTDPVLLLLAAPPFLAGVALVVAAVRRRNARLTSRRRVASFLPKQGVELLEVDARHLDHARTERAHDAPAISAVAGRWPRWRSGAR